MCVGLATMDGRRQMTPSQAMKAGIDMLVIGRPITDPPDWIGGSVNAARTIAEEIARGLYARSSRN